MLLFLSHLVLGLGVCYVYGFCITVETNIQMLSLEEEEHRAS